MRSRWLLVVLVASLCLNVAVIGAYLVHRRSHDRLRRFPSRRCAALADSAETADSLLWVEMRNDNPDSVRVDSFCQELGRIHGVMRAMVFRQMHHEIQLMPAAARAEYLTHMMRMKPAMPLRGHRFGRPGRGRAPHMRRGRMAPEDEEPMPEEPSPGPPAETGD
jgi:hypothetical protein